MVKLPITKKELLKEYTRRINKICDDLDWKTTFSGQEVCGLIHEIMIKNGLVTNLTSYKLHNAYNKAVTKLNITDAEWRENYKIPQIVGMVYDILEEKG